MRNKSSLLGLIIQLVTIWVDNYCSCFSVTLKHISDSHSHSTHCILQTSAVTESCLQFLLIYIACW